MAQMVPRELERFMAEISERVCAEAAHHGLPVSCIDIRATGRNPGEDYTYRGMVRPSLSRYDFVPDYCAPPSTPKPKKPAYLSDKLLLTKVG